MPSSFRFWFSHAGARARSSKPGFDWHAHFGAPRSDWSDSLCSDRGLLLGRLGVVPQLGIGEKGYKLLYSCTHNRFTSDGNPNTESTEALPLLSSIQQYNTESTEPLPVLGSIGQYSTEPNTERTEPLPLLSSFGWCSVGSGNEKESSCTVYIQANSKYLIYNSNGTIVTLSTQLTSLDTSTQSSTGLNSTSFTTVDR